MKLARKTDCYPIKLSKIQYSINCFTRKTVDQVELKVKKNDIINFVIVSNLITYLKIAFEDPNKKIIAQCKFH